MVFQVPNEFTPQTQQAISSNQMDANFDYVTAQLDTLQSQIGPTGGARTIPTKDTYTQRPQYSGIVAPVGGEFVDRKYLDATRGLRVGDALLSINPNAQPNDYGVVWQKMEGQQLSQTTYPAFYAICLAISSSTAGAYNCATGATAGNFVAPDPRGAALAPRLGTATTLPATVPNYANANAVGSIVGEAAHVQTLAELVGHTHSTLAFSSGGTGIASNGSSNGNVASTTGSTGSGTAFNVVQKTFIIDLWVRIA